MKSNSRESTYIPSCNNPASHLFFYHYLDGKPVHETISQNRQTFTSNILAVAFELFILNAIRYAYTQQSWSLYRRKVLKASIIDTLFSLPENPLGVFSVKLIRKAPIEWLIGLICAMMPIVITFPPSAIEVSPLEVSRVVDMELPWFNISHYGYVNTPEDDPDTGLLLDHLRLYSSSRMLSTVRPGGGM